MGTLIPRVHVCFGTPSHHLEKLLAAAAANDSLRWWTVNRSALPGDRAIFYMISPLSSFVATGVIAEEPRVMDDESSRWHGRYGAAMTDIQMLPRQVSIAEAKQQFPEWGFLRAPQRSSPVPAELAATFLSFLNAPEATPARCARADDIESTKTEAQCFKTKRSRRLRDLAFRLAKGVCCVCGHDFSKFLGGRGVRVLQVHHRKQLSTRDAPSVTTVEDLAVVCANCHMLLHLNPAEALSVEELRDMLQHDGFPGLG
jgi:hypothetical protein